MTTSASARSLLAVAAAAAEDALTFWLPISCAGCHAPDVVLCQTCRAALTPRPVRRDLDAGLVAWSGLAYEGPAARVLRALKEEGRTALARPLAPALAAAVAATRADGGGDALVTTVPSSRAAFRRRGYRPVDLLARRAGCRPVPLLRLRRTPHDQRGLDRDDRRRNVAGAFSSRPVPGRPVVLVDDVVTTGATLTAAATALLAAGAASVVAATLAQTPLRADARVNQR